MTQTFAPYQYFKIYIYTLKYKEMHEDYIRKFSVLPYLCLSYKYLFIAKFTSMTFGLIGFFKIGCFSL